MASWRLRWLDDGAVAVDDRHVRHTVFEASRSGETHVVRLGSVIQVHGEPPAAHAPPPIWHAVIEDAWERGQSVKVGQLRKSLAGPFIYII